MNLPVFCIKRPVFTVTITLVMVIMGIIGFMNLPVRWIPNVNPPSVTIETMYPGANANLVERDVTKVIEGALSGISGIETLSSYSQQGDSSVYITFQLGRDMNAAVEDVRSSIEHVRGVLPRDVQAPQVTKADRNHRPIMYISLYDANRTTRELSDYIDKYVLPAYETVDGVGSVAVYGKQLSAMQVRLDPAKMAGANVTVDEVAQVLREQNSSVPSGVIRGKDRFYSVVTNSALKTPAQFNELIIRNSQQDRPIRLKDIGETKLDAENSDFIFRVNGQSGIALGIIPQSNANPLDVEQRVQRLFKDLNRTLPKGIKAKILYNQADYIRASIHSVYESLFEAVIFVCLVILAFLCNFRATLIPIITIPACLISAFFILYAMGFSINTITLMAFVLAIGLVVDDAIVMLENINRHMEQGLTAFDAALKGSSEMIFPIIAMTLTLSAVYAPIAFTPGLLGVLFREFTFTLAGAVIISGVIALTLTPMMCARLLKATQGHTSRYARWLAYYSDYSQRQYKRALIYLFAKKRWVIGCLFLITAMGGGFYYFLPSELAPAEDSNTLFAYVSAPRNASYQYTDSFVRQLEAIYAKTPDIESYITLNYSAPSSYHILMLKPPSQREKSIQQLIESLSAQSNPISGVRINFSPPSPPLVEFAGGDSGDSLGLVMMTTLDYRTFQQSTQHLLDVIKQDPGFVHADNGLKWDSQQLQVNIDLERLSDSKVNLSSVTNTISTLIAGRQVGRTDNENIFVKINDKNLEDPNVFHDLYVRNIDNKMVPLANLLSVSGKSAPDTFEHYDRMRSDTVYLSLAPTLKLADAVKKLNKIAKENLPDSIKYTFAGEAKSFLDSNGKTLFTFILALVFIYLVLAAQFESFIDPLIILLTVPFAVVGAIITLKCFGGTLNIYSNIGLITLIGLIAKHGILITEFANRLRSKGVGVTEAVIEASLLRLRPILMTTSAMVLGALPLALAFGPGAESRQQIGLVITGGMFFGTFFSLIVVPIMYTYLSPFRKVFPPVSDSNDGLQLNVLVSANKG